MKLIYIGDHFYLESNTSMSCIYHESGERSDWGQVQVALRNGDEVHIRPASDSEIGPYERRLRALKKEREARIPRGV